VAAMTRCKFCNSKDIVRRGKRKTKNGERQINYCNTCKRRFSESPLPNYTYSPKAVIAAPEYYCLGYSISEIQKRIKRVYKVSPSLSIIHKWIHEFGALSPLFKHREKIQAFSEPGKVVGRRVLWHKQRYLYQFHKYKLSLFNSDFHKPIKDYLQSIVANPAKGDFVHRMSVSGLKLQSPKLWESNTFACKAATLALKAAETNHQRHAVIQRFLLLTDFNTVAAEVPVFLTPGETQSILNLDGGMLGHIDFLQFWENNITILDYKPEATKEKAHSQLLLYAIALSKCTGIHLKQIRCTWFDETISYSFNALDAYLLNRSILRA
jgi:transposase-like protein